MNHLVPEKRLDKNNRLVTKYVTADGGASTSTSLQAVSPVGSGAKEDRALKRLAGLIDDQKNEIKLASLPPETIASLKEISEHLVRDADANVLWRLMNPQQTKGNDGTLLSDIEGLAKYHRLEEGIALNETLSGVRGLWAYDFQRSDKLDRKTSQALIDTVSVALTVLEGKSDAYDYPPEDENESFVHGLDNYYSFFGGDHDESGTGELWVRNPDFVEMIREHVDKADQVFAIIRDRKSMDTHMIRAILETDTHPSLLEGVL